MKTFLIVLLIAFVVIFIVQRSHLIEKTNAYDPKIGMYKDEYHIKWINLQEYLIGVAEHSRESLKKLKELIPRKQ